MMQYTTHNIIWYNRQRTLLFQTIYILTNLVQGRGWGWKGRGICGRWHQGFDDGTAAVVMMVLMMVMVVMVNVWLIMTLPMLMMKQARPGCLPQWSLVFSYWWELFNIIFPKSQITAIYSYNVITHDKDLTWFKWHKWWPILPMAVSRLHLI